MLFFLLIVAISATKWHELTQTYDFTTYQREFNKNYQPHELTTRKSIFEHRMRQIIAHNSDPSKTWKQGVNKFTDMTDAELAKFRGSRPSKVASKNSIQQNFAFDISDLTVDWREKDVVTPVKNQGKCGSCWAFAAAETLESHYAIATGHLENLSEQQILDCTPNPTHCGGLGGCDGATIELAYVNIMRKGGLSSESSYPYTSFNGKNGPICQTSKPVAKMASFSVIEPNDFYTILVRLVEHGPLAVSIDASNWHLYESGVYDGCNKTHLDLNHAVQLVGMTNNSWIVRNSWGPEWGENGYIRLAMNPYNEKCAIDTTPQHGSGCDDGPTEITACGTCGILYEAVYPIIN